MLACTMSIPLISAPQLASASCLNASMPNHIDQACSRCGDACPAEAIQYTSSQATNPVTDPSSAHLPLLDTSACTGCTACVSICPTDALRHAAVKPAELVRQSIKLVQQGNTHIHATCSASNHQRADLRLPCHAAWSPLLLASLAAEGVRSLNLDGMEQCHDCPMQFGSKIMQQTEKDYTTLNHALGVRLRITSQSIPSEVRIDTKPAGEPERRAFFRNLMPSLAQSAATATAQIAQAAQQSMEQASLEGDNGTTKKPTKRPSPLPVRLQLFLRALPKLQSNFTPVPATPSLPLGSIQADARCNACGECVEQCPTSALYLKEFGANKILEFKANTCIGCSHCIDCCPEHAIEPLPGISLPAILTGKARPLVMVTGSNIKAQEHKLDNDRKE